MKPRPLSIVPGREFTESVREVADVQAAEDGGEQQAGLRPDGDHRFPCSQRWIPRGVPHGFHSGR